VTKTGKNAVADYNKYVEPEDEMWIKKINQKLTRSAYVTHGQFREDVHQILKNAHKYNQFSGSMCAHPGLLFVPCKLVSSQQECHQPSVLVSQHDCMTIIVCKHRSEVEVCLKAVLLLTCCDKLLSRCRETSIQVSEQRYALSLTVLLQMRLAWPTRSTRLPLLDWTSFQQRYMKQSNIFSKRRRPLICNS